MSLSIDGRIAWFGLYAAALIWVGVSVRLASAYYCQVADPRLAVASEPLLGHFQTAFSIPLRFDYLGWGLRPEGSIAPLGRVETFASHRHHSLTVSSFGSSPFDQNRPTQLSGRIDATTTMMRPTHSGGDRRRQQQQQHQRSRSPPKPPPQSSRSQSPLSLSSSSSSSSSLSSSAAASSSSSSSSVGGGAGGRTSGGGGSRRERREEDPEVVYMRLARQYRQLERDHKVRWWTNG